jgi:hypothetical protein
MVYTAPYHHDCYARTHGDGPPGSVWRCATCGAYWRRRAYNLLWGPQWDRIRGISLLWWKLRHHGKGKP